MDAGEDVESFEGGYLGEEEEERYISVFCID